MTGAGAASGRDPDRILTVPFVGLMVSNAFMRVSTTMLVTLVPLYVLGQGLSAAAAGATTTLYMLGAVLVRPLAGRLADARSRWAIVMVGVVIYTLATGLYLLTLPLWLFMLARAVQGVGFGLNGTAVMTLATDLIPERRMAQGIGYLGLEQMVAQMLAPWLALELRAAYDFEVAFVVAFAVAATTLLLRIPLAPTIKRLEAERRLAARRAGRGPVAGTRWLHRIVERNAWRPALVMFFVMFAMVTTNTFLAAYAIERGILNAGLFFAASGVMIALTRIVLGRIHLRSGNTWFVAIGILIVGVALVLMFWMPDLWVLGIAGGLFGVGMGAVNPGLNALAVVMADKNSRGLANATFFMMMDAANVVGGILLGLIAAAAGLGSVFLAAALLALAGLGLFLFLHARGLLSPSTGHFG